MSYSYFPICEAGLDFEKICEAVPMIDDVEGLFEVKAVLVALKICILAIKTNVGAFFYGTL